MRIMYLHRVPAVAESHAKYNSCTHIIHSFEHLPHEFPAWGHVQAQEQAFYIL